MWDDARELWPNKILKKLVDSLPKAYVLNKVSAEADQIGDRPPPAVDPTVERLDSQIAAVFVKEEYLESTALIHLAQ